MMLIIALCFDIQVRFRSIGERFKEMEKHFGRHISYFFPVESRIPYNPIPAPKINGYLRQTVVHRQCVSITFDTPFITQYLQKNFTQCDTRIFNGVVLIDMQITLSFYRKIQIARHGAIDLTVKISPNAIPVSSMVWCSSICKSPLAFTVRSIAPCRAIWSSI